MPLIKRGPPSVPPASPAPAAVASKLESGTVSERWAAARALGNDVNSVSVLARVLRTEQAPEVREAIFTSLVLIHSAEAAEALATAVRSDDAHLRTGALDALGAMMDVAEPMLPALLSDPDPDVRLLSCDLVRMLDPRKGTDLLCEVLETEQQPNVCGVAVDVLSEVGLGGALNVLRQCAVRFADDPYLGFAIADAIKRISTRPGGNE